MKRICLILLVATLVGCGPSADNVRKDFTQLVSERLSRDLQIKIEKVRSGNGDKTGRFEYIDFSIYVAQNTTLKTGLKLEQGKTIRDCTAALIYTKKSGWRIKQFEINCRSMADFKISAQV